MKEKRLLDHDFKWVPPHERKSRLPGTDKPHRIGPLEKRIPLLWVTRSEPIEAKSDVFLINDSGEILEEVTPDSAGLYLSDDDALPVSSQSKVIYQNVQPGEAVKIEEYDQFYDSDSILGLSVLVKSKKLGDMELSTYGSKGGIWGGVLLWDTLEVGENISKKIIR